jgi:hypothetical protein
MMLHGCLFGSTKVRQMIGRVSLLKHLNTA